MASSNDITAENLLLRLNALDEAPRIEAKEGREIGKSIRETISAFCNEPGLEGGYLVLGLKKTPTLFDFQYEVVGVADADKIQCDLATQCRDQFSTVVRPEIHVDELDGKKIVWAYFSEMPPGEKPVSIKSSGIAYRRIGPSDQKCSQDDLDYLYQLRAGRPYDQTPVPDGDLEDFDPEAIQEHRRLRGMANPNAWELTADDKDLLRSLHCLVYEDQQPSPTVAGIQLFGTQGALRRCFPMSRIDYIRVTGTHWIEDPAKRFETVEIRDSLMSAIRRTEAAILDDLPKAFHLPEGQLMRQDIPLLPSSVIREAVVNAVMHRSYRTHAPVSIIRYSNRLEIRNPGHSLKPEEELGQPGSKPRNPSISAVLHETHVAETKGSGIETMRKTMDQAGLEPPTFHSSRAKDEFSVTFLFHHFLSEENLAWLGLLGDFNLSQEDQKALVHTRETGFIDNASYRDINHVDTLTASGHLRHLRDVGLLDKRGESSKTFYLPGEKFPEPDNLSEKPDNLQEKPDNLDGKPDERLEVPELLSQMPERIRDKALGIGKRAPKKNLRHTIMLLCRWKELTVSQLAGILQRNRTFLLGEHIIPMVRNGELAPKYPQENHPQQAYRARTAMDEE